MARQAPATTRRVAAPPPPADAREMTIYEELWEAVSAADPKFAGPSENEDDQDFYKRIVRAVAAIPIDDWNNLSAASQQWYDDAAGAMENNLEIAALPGYADPDDEPPEDEEAEEEAAEGEEEVGEEGEEEAGEAEAEAEEAEPETPPARQSARDRMIAMNEKKRADKLAQAQTAAPRKITPPPAARRNAAPVAPARKAPAAPAAPARRGAPPTAPARKAAPTAPARKAPQPRVEAGPSNMELIRQLIVANQDITVDEIIQYMNDNHNFDAKQSTVTGVLTTTRATINTIKEMGHWAD